MTRATILALFLALLAWPAVAQEPRLEDYFPTGTDHDPAIPSPAAILGHEIGAWQLRPDQIVRYAEALAAASDRVEIQVQGRSHEQRPLVLLTLSSPRNLARQEEVRRRRRGLLDPDQEAARLDDLPLVIWTGHSIHGDEASGAAAALLLAYHLAAARDDATRALLEDCIVLIDPCLNPDGLARFALWANGNRGRRVNDDPRHREHRQAWPGGRGNHYWFDLNRDWLLATQPETRARLEIHRLWRPDVVADFHEMGSRSSYFFQPGVRSRGNPLIPPENVALTAAIAGWNAKALDRLGSLYYTEETFDDYYFGKGSTYPDAQGGIGILFEQASARGQAQRTPLGRLDLPFTIRNQLTTALATIAGARALRQEIQRYRLDFLTATRELAAAAPVKAWVFDSVETPARAEALVDLLLRHGIRVHRLGRDLEQEGRSFAAGRAFIVPARQAQYRLLASMFERRRRFADPVFYDVSTWNLLDAFDLSALELDGDQTDAAAFGEEVTALAPRVGGLVRLDDPAPYAFVWAWDAAESAGLVRALQDRGLIVLASAEPLVVATRNGRQRFDRGALVMPTGIARSPAAELRGLVAELAAESGVTVFETPSGLTAEGIDLGSPKIDPLRLPRILLLVGGACSAYEAGHLWHLLDHRLGLPVTLLDGDDLDAAVLADHDCLIAVGGAEVALGKQKDELIRWIRAGGNLVAQRGAAHWAGREILGLAEAEATSRPTAAAAKEERPRYADREERRARNRIAGAIFAAEIDSGHPLCWGIAGATLPLWKAGGKPLAAPANPLDVPVRFRSRPLPLTSGFAAEEVQKALAGSAAATLQRIGRGTVTRFSDETCFRGTWRGSERLMVNAVYMAPLVENTSPRDEDAVEESH
ncbi:MAG: hypothetical protein H6807_16130 [Planctomycetes bacterium]|nr:hypothetical protein [Planctomycetota bacterium]